MKEIDNLGCFERIFLSKYFCEICEFFSLFFGGGQMDMGGNCPHPAPPLVGAPALTQCLVLLITLGGKQTARMRMIEQQAKH